MSNCIIVLFKNHNTTCPASQSVLYSERQLCCLLGIYCEGRRGLEDSDDSTGISTNSPQIIEKQQISFDRTGLGLEIDGIGECYCHLSSNLVDFCKTGKRHIFSAFGRFSSLTYMYPTSSELSHLLHEQPGTHACWDQLVQIKPSPFNLGWQSTSNPAFQFGQT